MKINKKIRRIMTFVLAFALLCGIIPVNATVASAASASVSLSSLGRKGTVSIGSKTKSGTWWQMKLNGKKAFCINLGHTCHSGNTYSAEETHHWDQNTGGEKNGYYAKIVRWYVVDRNRSGKAFVMSQALIWSIAEGRNSEAQLKDVMKQVKGNINISPSKSVNDLYQDIFEPSGAWTADITFWQKTGNSNRYQKLLTVDADDVPEVASINDSDYYRQRITVTKKDEDGKNLAGIQFTLDADNLDDLYSFSMTDRDGTESSSADDDNDTSFSMTGFTRDSGRIAFRMTYRLQTQDYYYYPDSELKDMSADDKKAAKKHLADDLDLDEGVDFASDLTKESAKKLMDKEMKEMKNDISNTYTLTEDNTGDNKHIVMDPEFAKGVKITLKKADSWEKDAEGVWPDTLEEVASNYSKAYSVGVTNRYKKATIDVVKIDKYSADKKPHGDASLEGAQFQLYADASCTNKATVYDAQGIAKTAGIYTVQNGKMVTDFLRSGNTYYLKEVKAPVGYTLSNGVLTVKVDASNKAAEYTYDLATEEYGNQPILGKIAVQKYYSEGQTGLLNYEKETTFQIYLTSKGSYDACTDYERATITTNDKGYAETGDLYYGKYTVHQVDSGDVDAILAEDFPAEITENGKLYTFPADNIIFKAYLRILKKDGNTEKQVLKPGTTYQIYKVTDDGEKLVEQSYSNGNKNVTVNQFVTDESGEIMTVKELKSGTYRIYETDSASGLHITEKYIEVTINSKAGNYESFTDEDGYTHAVVTVTYTNQETAGRLKLYKTGEMLTGFQDDKFVYESRLLKGAVFEVTAAEDIVTQDNQGTHWYDKGDLVTTITTGEGAEFTKECKDITGCTVDEDGVVTVSLPLGKYHVKEKKTLYGYVLPDKGWDVELTWNNKDEEYVLNATDATDESGVLRVENARAKVQVSLFKSDAATKQAVAGAEFGIYTRHDIFNVDGEKIVDAGTRLGTVTTDTEGKAVSDLDFPLMSAEYQAETDSGNNETPSVEIPEETEKPAEPTAAPLPGMETLVKKISFAGMFLMAAPTEISALPETTAVPEETEEPEIPEKPEETGTPDMDAASGSAVTLNSGDYYLKELSVPGSYYLNETEYPVHLEYKDQETKVIAADVEAVNTQTSTVISKTSIANSEELPGCELQITDVAGSAIVSWTSGDKDSIKLNEKLEEMGYRNVTAVLDEKGAVQVNGLLHDMAYTLTETRPADGFVTADSISFQLVQGENGQTLVVLVNGENRTLQTDNIVHMVDDTTKVEISKTEIAGSEEIPGCELEITEKDTDTVIESWTSIKEKHIIEQKLAVGKTYILTEKRPADGYATADSIEFTIEDSGEVQSVQMKDDTTKIRLIKLAGDTGQGLRGAKFEVYDSNDKKVMGFTSREEGYDIIGKLKAGETYTFKEIEAPKGYQLAEPVKYTVKDTGEVQKVSFTDKKTPTPRVPQTGGTTPLVAAVILLFLLGCGFLLYRYGVRFSATSFFRKKRMRVK
jgi:hypothetical protein